MTNWTNKQKLENDFMGSFSFEARKYLGIEDGFPCEYPARWLLDSFQLLNIDWPNNFGDYSFVVFPASKGLEYWIFKIAADLGIEMKTNRAGVARDQIENNLELILSEVEKKLSERIKIDINYLRNFIQEYRNDIVHCDKKIDSLGSAKSKIFTIYSEINSITVKLIAAGLIK